MPTLLIYKATANIVCPTLVEKTTISPVYYLWEIQNNETLVKVYCIATEQSTQLQRYNKFTITETSTPIPLSGQVSLTEGLHTYTVYQQSSSTNLNPTGLTIVEQGILSCIDTTNNLNTEYAGPSTTNTAYP